MAARLGACRTPLLLLLLLLLSPCGAKKPAAEPLELSVRAKVESKGGALSASVTVTFPPGFTAAQLAEWRHGNALHVQLASEDGRLLHTAHEGGAGARWLRFRAPLRRPGRYTLNVTELFLRRASKAAPDHRQVWSQALEARGAETTPAQLPRCLDAAAPAQDWFDGAWELPEEAGGACERGRRPA